MPSSIHGKFFKSKSLDKDTAYLELKVNVALKGKYHIATDLQNRFKFADSGTFNTTGLQVIRLKPKGTPVDKSYTNFTVCYDTSCCPITHGSTPMYRSVKHLQAVLISPNISLRRFLPWSCCVSR
ncbi:hypothetical protein [Segetibacter koreensis]|uniref:hypothetical protein n=1 Tax=Segetibacter koreensis TaxID=398037 RepID=UPI0012F83B67|nr:hypothetical protein [Segetibacter koreensis]